MAGSGCGELSGLLGIIADPTTQTRSHGITVGLLAGGGYAECYHLKVQGWTLNIEPTLGFPLWTAEIHNGGSAWLGTSGLALGLSLSGQAQYVPQAESWLIGPTLAVQIEILEDLVDWPGFWLTRALKLGWTILIEPSSRAIGHVFTFSVTEIKLPALGPRRYPPDSDGH